ncbi:type I restriction enzyme endonuclease domain-containing protein [Pseudomonas abyssi]|nr:type I restriction enzyme endonuclease domain-containing protein [Halopseudomonas gallaeciensis]
MELAGLALRFALAQGVSKQKRRAYCSVGQRRRVRADYQQDRKALGDLGKAAYDICYNPEAISQSERDQIHFLPRGTLNRLQAHQRQCCADERSRARNGRRSTEGIEEIFKLGENGTAEMDIFDDDYLAKIEKIKLPNTRIKLLQHLLAKHGYPPVDRDEVYKEIFEQAENYKTHRASLSAS